MDGARRDLAACPRAHLHLHLTGGMRRDTLHELAAEQGRNLPAALAGDPGGAISGWARFQRLYDLARDVLAAPEHLFRLLREIGEDEAAAGSGWVEVQVTPTGYARRFGGIVGFTELLVDAAAAAGRDTGVGIGLVIAANRTRPPAEALTLARLAVRFAGRGVVGFGLSNDERAGAAEEYARAFALARRAGLLAVPHGGELCGPASVRACVTTLGAHRIGHAVRAAEDPATLALLAERGVAAEVCPSSNVALGVAPTAADVPLRALLAAGVPVALGADDPVLFGAHLLDQYQLARDVHGLTDAELAAVAGTSVRASAAPAALKARLLAGVDAWLRGAPPTSGAPTQ